MTFTGYSDADLVRAAQAERKAIVSLVWLEYARHITAAEEAEERGDEEEAERHESEADMLKRLAEEIEKRGGKAPNEPPCPECKGTGWISWFPDPISKPLDRRCEFCQGTGRQRAPT